MLICCLEKRTVAVRGWRLSSSYSRTICSPASLFWTIISASSKVCASRTMRVCAAMLAFHDAMLPRKPSMFSRFSAICRLYVARMNVFSASPSSSLQRSSTVATKFGSMLSRSAATMPSNTAPSSLR